MYAQNEVRMRGYVANEPVHNVASTGTPVLNFRIAVAQPVSAEKRQANRQTGADDPTDFFNIRAFNGVATSMQNTDLASGDFISVEGTLRVDSRKDQDSGLFSNYTYIIANRIDLLPSRKRILAAMKQGDDAAAPEPEAVADAPSTEQLEALAAGSKK